MMLVVLICGIALGGLALDPRRTATPSAQKPAKPPPTRQLPMPVEDKGMAGIRPIEGKGYTGLPPTQPIGPWRPQIRVLPPTPQSDESPTATPVPTADGTLSATFDDQRVTVRTPDGAEYTVTLEDRAPVKQPESLPAQVFESPPVGPEQPVEGSVPTNRAGAANLATQHGDELVFENLAIAKSRGKFEWEIHCVARREVQDTMRSVTYTLPPSYWPRSVTSTARGQGFPVTRTGTSTHTRSKHPIAIKVTFVDGSEANTGHVLSLPDE